MRFLPHRRPFGRLALLLLLALLLVGVAIGLEGPAPAAEEELEEFVPSEQIRADSAVSFPVDI